MARLVRYGMVAVSALTLGVLALLLGSNEAPDSSAFVLLTLIGPSLSLLYAYLTRDGEERALERAVHKAELRQRLKELDAGDARVARTDEARHRRTEEHLDLLKLYLEKCMDTMGATEMENVLNVMESNGYPARVLLKEVRAARAKRAK